MLCPYEVTIFVKDLLTTKERNIHLFRRVFSFPSTINLLCLQSMCLYVFNRIFRNFPKNYLSYKNFCTHTHKSRPGWPLVDRIPFVNVTLILLIHWTLGDYRDSRVTFHFIFNNRFPFLYHKTYFTCSTIIYLFFSNGFIKCVKIRVFPGSLR